MSPGKPRYHVGDVRVRNDRSQILIQIRRESSPWVIRLLWRDEEKYSRVPLSRESPAELNELRKGLEELRQENQRLKTDRVLDRQGWGDALEQGHERDREWMLKLEALQREVEALKKKP